LELLALVRPALHIGLHALVPGLVARVFWPGRFLHAWAVMMAAMLIDLDHLLASPLYDPDRCSLQAHPLHGLAPVGVYFLLLWPARTRVLAVGLLLHILLDGADCLAMGTWAS